MKNSKIQALISQALVPGLLVLFGFVLLMNPDSASRLIASILGWVLMAVGVLYAISAITGRKQGSATQTDITKSGTVAAAGIIIGAFLIARPLALAALVGRIAGVLVILRGALQLKQDSRKSGAVLTIVAGAILLLLPMTASRLVFRLCGGAMLVFGGLTLYANLSGKHRLNSSEDDIIDIL